MNNDLAIMALKALDGLSMRAEVTAQNIANAGTPGYRPLQISFEDALAAAAGRGPAEISKVTPHIEVAPPHGGSAALRLDLEMQTASATALRYAAIVNILNREMQIHTLATTGGR